MVRRGFAAIAICGWCPRRKRTLFQGRQSWVTKKVARLVLLGNMVLLRYLVYSHWSGETLSTRWVEGQKQPRILASRLGSFPSKPSNDLRPKQNWHELQGQKVIRVRGRPTLQVNSLPWSEPSWRHLWPAHREPETLYSIFRSMSLAASLTTAQYYSQQIPSLVVKPNGKAKTKRPMTKHIFLGKVKQEFCPDSI